MTWWESLLIFLGGYVSGALLAYVVTMILIGRGMRQ
jgi:hypothetical protein